MDIEVETGSSEVESGGSGYQPFSLESTDESPRHTENGPEIEDLEPTGDAAGDTSGEEQSAAPPARAPRQQRVEPSAQENELRAEITRLNNGYNQMLGLVAPLLQREAGKPGVPRLTKEDLIEKARNGTGTLDDLANWVDQEMASREQQLIGRMGQTAQRVQSEQKWRGVLNGESLGGNGRDYDAMINKYVRPAYENNPILKQVIESEFNGDPALAEYGLSCLFRLAEYSKDDPAKAYRAFHDFLDGKPNRDLARKIADNAKSGADRIAGQADARPAKRSQNYVPGEMRRMAENDPSAFAKLERDITGG